MIYPTLLPCNPASRIPHPASRIPHPASRSTAGRIPLTLLLSIGLLVANAQTLTVTLNPSQYNGFNIGCFGEKSGSITTSVTGGTAPYTYVWTNGKTTGNITDLSAGYYKVAVYDANNLTGDASITLTEPEALEVLADPFKYPAGDHISCFNCFNGSIDVTVTKGVAPYTYDWGDGIVAQDRSGLGDGSYLVTVTDLNGCFEKVDITLTQPERSDWTMNGNAGTNPAVQYIGTSDNKDVVFKSNGQERLRLLADGTLKLGSLASSSNCHLLYVDENGVVKKAGGTGDPVCTTLPWYLGGNNNVDNTNNRIGTNEPFDLLMITDANEKMRVTVEGKVGIGTVPPSGPIDQYRLFVEDGIVTRDVLVQTGAWPDYVFEDAYHLMPFIDLKAYLKAYKHLPGIPSAADVDAKNGIDIGDMQTRLVKVVEEQMLYIIEQNERMNELELRLQRLEKVQR